MEYRLALFFVSFYYLRPQDWVPGLAGMNLVQPIIGLWILVLFAYRQYQSPVPGLVRTPHDWLILIYFGYIMWATPDWNFAFSDIFSLVTFYALTVQSLTNWSQVYGYLRWWNAMMLAIAAIGLLSLVGVDPTGAIPLTESKYGRLSIGTWLHNNPNALGHTVVAIIPLSYFLFFWRGTVSGRFIVFPLCFLAAGACAWFTESKGAFLVGGILVVLIFVIGRHRIVQISAIVLAMTVGVSALSFLPRMEHMGSIQSDEGVIGRVMAWDLARTATRENATGVGYRQFRALIDWVDGTRVYHDIPKATHSSYISVGADLGIYGLALYLGLMWLALRTVAFMKTGNDLEERCRRSMVILLLANVISGWMINRGYHTEFFLLVAVSAAMHRLRLAAARPATAEADTGAPVPAAGYELPAGSLIPAGAGGGMAVALPDRVFSLPGDGLAPAYPLEGGARRAAAPAGPKKKIWNRFDWIDVAAIVAATWAVLEVWDYVIGMI